MNRQKRVKRNLMVSLITTLTTITVVGITTGLALYYLFPTHWFQWYPIIPAYFIVLGIITSMGATQYAQQTVKKFISSFFLMRGIKIALTLCFIFVYKWLVNENMKEAVLVTLAFYMLHLFIETTLFYCFEKNTKQNG
jgi:hypothetical protein